MSTGPPRLTSRPQTSGADMRNSSKCTPVFLAVLALAASACGSSSKSNSGSATPTTGGSSTLFSQLPAAIQSSKEIKVGSDIEYAPIEFYKEGTTQTEGV